jgi:hypothetical protein
VTVQKRCGSFFLVGWVLLDSCCWFNSPNHKLEGVADSLTHSCIHTHTHTHVKSVEEKVIVE